MNCIKLTQHPTLIKQFFTVLVSCLIALATAFPINAQETTEADEALLKELREILPLLHKEGFIKPASMKTHHSKAIESFLEAFNIHGKYVPAGATVDQTTQTEASAEELEAMIHQTTHKSYIQYMSTRTMSDNVAQKLTQHIEELSKDIMCLIFDFRYTEGHAPEKLEALENKLVKKELPVAFLVNGQTSGAAELLIKVLESERPKQIVIIGQNSAGAPFPLKPRELSNGAELFLPSQNGSFGNDQEWPPQPIQVNIAIEKAVMKEELKDWEAPETELIDETRLNHDEALRRAVELMIAVRTFHD
jgi:Fe-S cluster biosynthesis and repair protein YggX